MSSDLDSAVDTILNESNYFLFASSKAPSFQGKSTNLHSVIYHFLPNNVAVADVVRDIDHLLHVNLFQLRIAADIVYLHPLGDVRIRLPFKVYMYNFHQWYRLLIVKSCE